MMRSSSVSDKRTGGKRAKHRRRPAVGQRFHRGLCGAATQLERAAGRLREPSLERNGDHCQLAPRGGQLVLEHPGEAVATPLADRIDLDQAPELRPQGRLGGEPTLTPQVRLLLRAVRERPQVPR